MSIVPIQGLWETHLTVADLDRSIGFYRDVVGLTLAHIVPERHAAFFWICQPRQAMLGLWSVHTSPMAMRLRYPFQVTLEHVQASVAALRQAGLQPVSGSGGRPTGEPEVIPWIPAASVYFRDPDGHLLEFIAMLPEPPRPQMPPVMLRSGANCMQRPGRQTRDEFISMMRRTNPQFLAANSRSSTEPVHAKSGALGEPRFGNERLSLATAVVAPLTIGFPTTMLPLAMRSPIAVVPIAVIAVTGPNVEANARHADDHVRMGLRQCCNANGAKGQTCGKKRFHWQ